MVHILPGWLTSLRDLERRVCLGHPRRMWGRGEHLAVLWALCLAQGSAHCSKPSGVPINLKEACRSQSQEQPRTFVSLVLS